MPIFRFRRFCGLLRAERAVDLLCRIPFHLCGDVGVDVQRGFSRRMTEYLRKCFDVKSIFKRGGCKSMSKPMNGICLHPARLSISESRFLQWQGLIGRLGSIGDGKIHSEFTRFRYSAKTFSTDSGKRTVLVEVLVLGVRMMKVEPSGVYSRRTLSSPVSKFRSSHRRPSNSPRRRPVASASRIIS